HAAWILNLPGEVKVFFDPPVLPDAPFVLWDSKIGDGLTIILKLINVTTCASNRWRTTMSGDPPRKNATRFLRVICHPRVRVRYHALYDINNVTPQRVERFLQDVRHEMAHY